MATRTCASGLAQEVAVGVAFPRAAQAAHLDPVLDPQHPHHLFAVTVGTLQAALDFNNGDGVLLPQVRPQDVGVAAALVQELRRLFPAGVSGGKQTLS